MSEGGWQEVWQDAPVGVRSYDDGRLVLEFDDGAGWPVGYLHPLASPLPEAPTAIPIWHADMLPYSQQGAVAASLRKPVKSCADPDYCAEYGCMCNLAAEAELAQQRAQDSYACDHCHHPFPLYAKCASYPHLCPVCCGHQSCAQEHRYLWEDW